MKKNFALFTLLVAGMLLASCTDENAEPPVVSFTKDTVWINNGDTADIEGTIVAEAGLVSVTIEDSKGTASWWPETLKSFGGSSVLVSSYPIVEGDNNKYTVGINSGKYYSGTAIVSSVTGGDFQVGNFVPGNYELRATDKNGNLGKASFVIAVKGGAYDANASTGGNDDENNDENNDDENNTTTFTYEQLLTNIPDAGWTVGVDTIGRTMFAQDSFYFYKQGTTKGVLKVNYLVADSANLTLYSVSGNTLNKIGTAGVGISSKTNGKSYFTNDGAAATKAELATTNGTKTFVAIGTNYPGQLITKSKMTSGTTDAAAVTGATEVSFLSVKVIRAAAEATTSGN